ncbi:MAG: hypothetical protein IIX40_07885 [Alistipes sp.]|nr:hypothetical protein [Alistipes sp.]
MKKCFQVLFNRPLQFEDEVIYGFRVPCDERALRLANYCVEEVIGKWCFISRHGGKIVDKTKWVDMSGRVYHSGAATRLYSYTASLNTNTYFRVDEYWVDDDYNFEDANITEQDWFNLRCEMEGQDYRTGYNGWLQSYQKVFSRYQRQLCVADNGITKLDFDVQEGLMWMSKNL